MSVKPLLTVALVGNPNSGKSSIFNQLTGLRQKVGNFPGVTVDKKEGIVPLEDGKTIRLIDYPGAYSLYPNAQDERIVAQTFADPRNPDFPDAVLYIADVTSLEKHLLLFTQLCDLEIPIILGLNMADVATKDGIRIDLPKLADYFQVPVVLVSGRTSEGISGLKKQLAELYQPGQVIKPRSIYKPDGEESTLTETVRKILPTRTSYQALLIAHHAPWLPNMDERLSQLSFDTVKHQVKETLTRYDVFTPVVRAALSYPQHREKKLTAHLDQILTHRIAGPIIFFLLMSLIFQSIFNWATYPMDWIEMLIGSLSTALSAILPEGWISNLITEGLLAGLGGTLVFIPQIAILFLLISLLEEVGYMARAAFLFDRIMRSFGLNGRSIVALISGGACAIPAIMSTRTISNWKERLITILVTPFISCSARIPVYTVLIGFAVPAQKIAGFINLQGLAFMGLYLLGIVAALLSGWILKIVLKTDERSFLMLEMPPYRTPVFRNIALTVWEKVSTFVVEAGKVIIVISMILWALSSYGPSGQMDLASLEANTQADGQNLSEVSRDDLIAARRIEASWAGQMGKFIEPAIAPLGFDWKMGIALITSFAAREVFVGTMATIYSIGSAQDELSVRDRMAAERHPVTGLPVYSLATSLSLLMFYVFALQCMSTIAVVRRETKSWRWPLLQFFFMSGLAYLASFVTYQLFS
jgi:ferrous iron transport protein B